MRPHEIHEAVCSQVAQLLKREREQQQLSLNLLAEKAGLSRQTITFLEEESRIPKLDTLLRVAAALEIDLETVIAHARKIVAQNLSPRPPASATHNQKRKS